MEKSGSLAGEDCAGWDELVGVISTGKTYQNQMAALSRAAVKPAGR
jgi:predicted RNase H-like HicB family nuclease